MIILILKFEKRAQNYVLGLKMFVQYLHDDTVQKSHLSIMTGKKYFRRGSSSLWCFSSNSPGAGETVRVMEH